MKGGIMKVKWRCLVAFVMFVSAMPAAAQQMYQFSQFAFNNYLLNPAVVGTYNFYQIRTNHRFQWVGVSDAPMTNIVSVHGPHSRLPMGFGGMFFSDITGPTSKTGVMGSYAYNIPINSEMRVSGGLSVGFMAFRIDASKFDLGDNVTFEDDPALLNYRPKTVFTPDASIGFYLYATHFYVGISAHQLFGQRLRFYDNSIMKNQLRQAFYISGGYLIFLTEDFELEPAAVLRYTYPSPFQFDLNVKCTYRNMVWGGVSYRFRDAVSILFGYQHKGRILFGYSFDFSYTGLRRFNGGSHELLIGYQFDKIK